MPDILITGLDEKIVALLGERAASHGRTLEDEARHILEDAIERDRRHRTFWQRADALRAATAGREHSGSADLVREDRASTAGTGEFARAIIMISLRRTFMADVLVRNLDPATIARLKARADSHGRSLQAELARILEDAGREQERRARFRRWAEEFGRTFEGRVLSDSADLIREDRDTDHGRDG